MNLSPRSFAPKNFLNSWQFQKIEDLHGPRLATNCFVTLATMCDWAADHAPSHGAMTYRQALALARSADYRQKHRELWALRQANVLRRTEHGLTLLGWGAGPTDPSRRQPTAQMALALPQQASGFKPTADVPPPHPTADQVWTDAEKAEQNQATNLARAVAYSSTQGDDAPPIDPAPSCTEVLQATDSERSDAVSQEATATGALAPCLLPLRAQAKKQSKDAEPLNLCGGSQQKPAKAQASQPLQPLSSLLQQLMSDRSEVERLIEPPSRIEEEPALTQPVKPQRVIKQQKVVKCREPSSTAVSLNLPEGGLTPPKLYPDAADITQATAKTWPSNPVKGRLAEEIVQMQASWSELRTALDAIEKDMAEGHYKGPPVLIHVLRDVRERRRVEEAKRKRPQNAAGSSADRWSDRKALADAINGHLGEEMRAHWCQAEPYLDAMMGQSVDGIVSMYAEMCGRTREVDLNYWPMTAQAFAAGETVSRLGQMPPAPMSSDDVSAILERFGLKAPANVQLSVDKTAQAG